MAHRLVFVLLLALLSAFTPIHSLIPGTVPDSVSPELPADPNTPDLVPTNLSALPSQIFVTDGDIRYLPIILNCVGSLLKFNVSIEEIFVITYAPDITRELHRFGVRTLYRPDWLEEARALVQRYNCDVKAGKEQMDLVMYMKQRLLLETARRGVRFMLFDSDVVFHSSPQLVMDADKEPSLFGENADAVIYGASTVSIGSMRGWTNGPGRKFGLNCSPGAFLNSELLVPLWMANMQYGQKLWERCLWGWGQYSINALLYQLGLRWEMLLDEQGRFDRSVYRSKWVDPTPGPTGQRNPLHEMINQSLYDELVNKAPRHLNLVVSDTDRPQMPAHHYHAMGGPHKKQKVIKKGKQWFVRNDWRQIVGKVESVEEVFTF